MPAPHPHRLIASFFKLTSDRSAMNLPLWTPITDAATVLTRLQPMPLPQRPHSLFLIKFCASLEELPWSSDSDFGTQISSSCSFPHVVYFSELWAFWGDISRTLDVIVEPDSLQDRMLLADGTINPPGSRRYLSLGEQGIPVLKKPRY